MKRDCFCIPGFIAAALSLGMVQTSLADGQYRLLKEIPVSGDSRWDYLSIDPAARRLYVAHSSEVAIINLDNQTVIGAITNTPGVHGFAIAPETQRGFASNGQEGTVSVVDLASLQTLYKVTAGNNPDCVVFEPKMGEVYAFNGRDESATVFDPTTGKVAITISLPGKPEFAVADPKAGLVYDNIEDLNEIVQIDAKYHQVCGLWSIAPGQSPSAMAMDTRHHRLFIGCHNNLMLMVSTKDGHVMANVPIGQGVDASAFDAKTGLVFASCGDGTVTIAKEDGDSLSVVQTLKTEPGARTMALDPKTHDIYLATAEINPNDPPGENQAFVPGTFKILVYGSQ